MLYAQSSLGRSSLQNSPLKTTGKTSEDQVSNAQFSISFVVELPYYSQDFGITKGVAVPNYNHDRTMKFLDYMLGHLFLLRHFDPGLK